MATSLKAANECITELERFRAPNLQGYWEREDVSTNTPQYYCVFSYETLIAVCDGNEKAWITKAKYTATTSKHVAMVRRAWIDCALYDTLDDLKKANGVEPPVVVPATPKPYHRVRRG